MECKRISTEWRAYLLLTLLFLCSLIEANVGVHRVALEKRGHYISVESHMRKSGHFSRNSRLVENDFYDAYEPLFGNLAETHMYYATVEVGNQTFTVQIDTGSVALAFPDQYCHEYNLPTDSKAVGQCGGSNPFYVETSTSVIQSCSEDCTLCQNHDCWFSIQYEDGSFIRGPLIEDDVSIGGLSTQSVFGAIERESPGFSIASCDGILGMAFEALDSSSGNSLVQQLYNAGKLQANVFSICLGPTAGELYLGGYNPDLDEDQIIFVPMQTPYDYYRVLLQDITVGGYALGASSSDFGSAIVDSGTTLILLPEPVFTQLESIFEENFSTLPHISTPPSLFNGFCVTGINLDEYPTLEFTISNIPLQLEASDYLIEGITLGGEQCHYLGFGVIGSTETILGDVFMQAFNVIFNKDSHQVGFSSIRQCAETGYSASIVSGDNLYVRAGDQVSIQVAVHYSITHAPVSGIIVEFITTNGKTDFTEPVGRMTDGSGVATLEFTILVNGTCTVTAATPGAVSPPLVFNIQAFGEAPSSLLSPYTYYYNEWKTENNDFIFGIPSWIWLAACAIILILVVGLSGFIITCAVRVFRDQRYNDSENNSVEDHDRNDLARLLSLASEDRPFDEKGEFDL